MCHNNYREENREPPCYKENICSVINDEPFELLNENKFSWETYLEIQSISMTDQNGLPTIEKIDFYLNRFDLGLDKLEMEILIEKIMYIHSYYRNCLWEKIKPQG